VAARGPVEFTGAEGAFIFGFVAVVPPFVFAVIGWAVHAVVTVRRGRDIGLLRLFLRWWGWCTAGWVGAWFLAILFS
jgi:hypothetical protein